ncbi:MAG: DUF6067 family protein [Fimbriimonas sp.]|nr:DUF6067 family protein [Fimbriimonas sp.]
MGLSCLFVAAPLLLAGLMSNQIEQSPTTQAYATDDQASRWRQEFKDRRVIVVADSREHPVKRTDRIPAQWLGTSLTSEPSFSGKAQPGEFYVFQVSLYNNGSQPITVCSVDLDMGPDAVHAVCLNRAVSQEPGRHIKVPAQRIQTLWCGVEFDRPGAFTGRVQASVSLGESGEFQTVTVPVTLDVTGQPVANHGFDEGWRLARLQWLLPSDLGLKAEPTKRFKPVVRLGNRIDLTSTRLTLARSGLPAQIASLDAPNLGMLAAPTDFAVVTDKGPIQWNHAATSYDPPRMDREAWSNLWRSKAADVRCDGSVEFDGFVRYRLTLTANERLVLKDVRLTAPYRSASAKYQLGLGYRGGYTPERTDWKWNVAFQQDCIWLGDVSVGAQWRFKGDNYVRPLVNIYYGYRPLNLPDSWGNEGRGSIRVLPEKFATRLLQAASGPRTMEAGESLAFDFDIQITPSRPIDTEAQWSTRYYHPGDLPPTGKLDEAIDTAVKDGANVVNIHHRKQMNPFINYPFNDFSVPDLKSFVASAHARDVRVKLYYTTRELTWQLPEIWALKSFGDSIIEAGPGADARTVLHPNGPDPRLTEALEKNFIPAWATSLDGKYEGKVDLAVITRPDSAWTDYYLHGLDWLVNNVQIDGTYIDDTALDRVSLQRARRILEAGRPAPLIDLHSWNHEDPLAARGSSTSIYMELFPYIDRIWFGEGFDYTDATPDYWLVAMSGIPYGVMSEMLQGGGNVWRGMLFGETCRLGWSGDPRSMWKFWDRFGMSGSKMIGWWDAACPVHTDSKDVLATVYRKGAKTLIAIANWSKQDRACHLQIDWKALGLDPKTTSLTAEPIDGFQASGSWSPSDSISVPGAKGWLIVAQPR